MCEGQALSAIEACCYHPDPNFGLTDALRTLEQLYIHIGNADEAYISPLRHGHVIRGEEDDLKGFFI